ncbi:MAG TPA: phosphoenolpyruvate--protein phosphotransferase [Candidatus Sulfotelmatobacter sp.]|nr:phosphoenolpyruvate--protein phosphotransferase [Candidatus Sulfotelmatobacter sp.]
MSEVAAWTGSRRLLKRLRDVMAVEASAQIRLDRIVRLIAADMVAEVCSAYLLRAGEVLELFATEGLNPDAVHKTRLRIGEGLVGDIAAHARPLALADAWSHPSFAYRPETGEDIYQSLMGVPIQRGGRVLGVLVVQNRATRAYTEEEIETLETVAMVLAELVATGELVDPAEAQGTQVEIALRRLEGVRLNGGLAIGYAVLHQPRVTIRQMIAEDPKAELERLRSAVAIMHTAIDLMLAADDLASTGEHRDVLETYRMFAEDRGWLNRIREAIRTGLTAEAAVQKVQNDMRARLREVTDPYLKERLLDLEDLTNRLLLHLSGAAAEAPLALPEDVVLVARSMGPVELLDYDRKQLRGLVLEEGSTTSHVAIVARALDIPVVGRVAGVLDRVDPNDPIVVDGDNAQVFLRPGEDILQSVRETMRVRAEQSARYEALKGLPPITRDGEAVTLLLNCGLQIDVTSLDATNAAGVGLYRTEIPFMMRATYPDVATQTELYRRILDQAGDRPVTFRTLDIGGDKVLPYFNGGIDENPAMGWRAVRISLDRPAMLRHQLRAMIAAAAGRRLVVMFPMIAEVAEFDQARAILDAELQRAARTGDGLPQAVRVGAMLEVPALMWQTKALLERVDFLSVGSNDLLQFLFAADRGSPQVAERYDPLSPPVLGLLRDLVERCKAAEVPVTLCGEMASRPLEAMALLGVGLRSLSMPPGAVGSVKMMTRSLDVKRLARFLDRLIDSPHHSLRELLRGFARDHGVVV